MATAETTETTNNADPSKPTPEKKSFPRGRGGKPGFKKRGNRRGGRDSEPKEFMEEVLQIDRVTRVVKGGRRLRFRVTVIIGDRKGRVGLGIGKSTEVLGGIQKAIADAKKNLLKLNLDKGTIAHAVKIKHKSARILLMPGREGSGIIAGGAVRKICDLAGIENVVGKIFGTNNKIVNAQATMLALQSLYVPKKKKEEKKEEDQKTEKKVEKKAAPKAEKKAAPKAKKETKKEEKKETKKK